MRSSFVRTTFAVAACMVMGASVASAQTRTWVSGIGDDVNPCSRTAPCKTFAGAISKTAAGGEISVLDPAGYGSVTITKSITISGVGENASILGTGTNGIIINAGPGDLVTLKGLIINGAGTGLIGIKFMAGANLIVDDVHVLGFATGIDTAGGLTTVTRSLFTNNRQFGVHSRGGSTINLEDSVLVANGVGVQASDSSTVRMSNNAVYSNQTGFGCGGGTLATASNNRKAGNGGGGVPSCSPTVAITVE